MHLTYRPARPTDVESCAQLLPAAFRCDPGLRSQLPDVWRSWLIAGRLLLCVAEDHERPAGSRVVAFGASVFLTDAFSQEAQSGLPPYISAQIARRHLDGETVILDREGIRDGNSGRGLNLLVLHLGWTEEGYGEDDLRRLKDRMMEAFHFNHSGYFLREMMQEVFSTAEMRRGQAIGVALLNDYAAYYEERGLEPPPDNERPYLVAIRREEIAEGSYVTRSFLYTRPRFFFKDGEQELLFRALANETDEEIAEALCLSVSAVHKRWRSIYTRVAAVAPEILGPGSVIEPTATTRGTEKRWRLLRYLREHLEELRPCRPPLDLRVRE